jgi:hypothetical protein
MKQRKIPMRSCVVTREKCEKKDLIRIVRTPEGKVEIDLNGKTNGRGAYIKRSIEVINKAKTSKILDKHLETKVPEEIYEELTNIINQD